jgi:hypothetical protein
MRFSVGVSDPNQFPYCLGTNGNIAQVTSSARMLLASILELATVALAQGYSLHDTQASQPLSFAHFS